MVLYRPALPQLGGGLYLTDGGLETTPIFHEGREVPGFAAFHLLGTPQGRTARRKYFHACADIAGSVATNTTPRKRRGSSADASAPAGMATFQITSCLRSKHRLATTHKSK